MPRCRVDPELTRTVIDGFAFPLGVYPIEPMKPVAGYSMQFEPSDAGEEGQFEEWPDRYVFDIVISAERLEPLCRSLLGLLPGRIFPILDYLGHDQYREVDPYISYDLIGTDRLMDAIRRYRGFFLEDGLCGFGAMTDDPFLYIFVDEHKIVTVRCEPPRREKVERILQAFDLEPLAVSPVPAPSASGSAAGATSVPSPAGADAAAHEHRTVLITADDRPDLLTADEIVEDLRDEWNLVLNVNPEDNIDEEGNELGITPWRCLVRVSIAPDEPETTESPSADGADAAPSPAPSPAEPAVLEEASIIRYADVVLTAGSLRSAEQLALEAVDDLDPESLWDEATVVFADRVRPEMLEEFIRTHDGGGEKGRGRSSRRTTENSLREERIIWTDWLE